MKKFFVIVRKSFWVEIYSENKENASTVFLTKFKEYRTEEIEILTEQEFRWNM